MHQRQVSLKAIFLTKIRQNIFISKAKALCHPLENADEFLLKCKFENVLPIDQMLNGKP